MRRFLQPAAACVLLVIGALPVLTLACVWACAPPMAGQTHHHEAHHQVAASGIPGATDGPGASLVSTEPRCDHAQAKFVAISPALAQFGAPAAITPLFGELLPMSVAASVVVTTPSPPGTPPRPFSLRL